MTQPVPDSPTFELTSSGVQVRARMRGDQFVVLAGSTARAGAVLSFESHSGAPYGSRRAN